MTSQPGGAPRRAVLLAAAVLGLLSVPGAVAQPLASAPQSAAPGNGGLPQILVLSNRADLVSGGDALVQVVLPARVDPGTVRVSLNGSDVTSAFAVRADGRYEGLVTGLAVGENDLMATMRLGPTIHLTITNHPSGGPIFAGPQVQPWICRNTMFGFGTPTDAQCNTTAAYSYVYRDAVTNTFNPYDPAAPPPTAAIANTTTDQGTTVPYIVRLEKGAMDRGLYDVAVLSNPSAGWAPWASQSGWNHKVLYQFGGGTAPWHTNGPPGSDLINMALSRGFLVANNNLNIRGQNANDVVSAEALMMLKEHIAEAYGSIRYTIGAGCSGGSIQQHQIAANYPGLLDGIQPNCSYQDSWTTANEVNDCHLLQHFFNTLAPGSFSAVQQAAVAYTQDTTACLFWDLSFAPVGIPSRVLNCNLVGTPEAAQVYPNGPVRCDVQDYQSAIWGFRPQDGFARSPYANVGVQYGLSSVNAGTITPEQFVELNEGVGGTDIDLNFTAARAQPDLVAQSIAYRTGQVTNGTQLANVPIIDLRGSHNFNDIHTDYHSWVMRARLDAANGTHANQLIWTWNGAPPLSIGPPPAIALKSFLLMDSWLSSIESDIRDVPLSQKVLDDKPAGAVDECFIGPTLIETTDAATCASTFPHYGDARLAAGESLVDNAMQCQLKPLDPANYAVTFTAAQWTRLQQTFADGVCDWSRPPVGFQPSIPWLTFAGGPGGQPIGPAPESHPGPAKQ